MNRDEFLASQKMLRLATISGDGAPHIVPVWYLFRDGKFYIGTSMRTKKAKNLTRRGQAAFCVDEGVCSPIRGVAGNGPVKLIRERSRVREIAREILLRYYTSMQDKGASELLEDTDCIIEISPDVYHEWSY